MVAYCSSSRRIDFGVHNGNCVVHELRAAKSHNLQSHQGPVTACAFSEDGKYLATYGASDAKINFWHDAELPRHGSYPDEADEHSRRRLQQSPRVPLVSRSIRNSC